MDHSPFPYVAFPFFPLGPLPHSMSAHALKDIVIDDHLIRYSVAKPQ